MQRLHNEPIQARPAMLGGLFSSTLVRLQAFPTGTDGLRTGPKRLPTLKHDCETSFSVYG